MALNGEQVNMTREAGQDLSSKQYHFVTVASDAQVDATGDGLQAHGVLQNDPSAAGQGANLCALGQTKCYAGGTCTAGAVIASDAAGRAVNAASGDFGLGYALEAATTDGQVISIWFQPLGKIW